MRRCEVPGGSPSQRATPSEPNLGAYGQAFLRTLVSCACLAAVSPAQAQEILLTGPLAGAPGPRENQREGRLELGALAGAGLGSNDKRSLYFGGEARYYVWDRFGAGFFGAGVVPLGTGGTWLTAIAVPELVVVPFAGRGRTLFDSFT